MGYPLLNTPYNLLSLPIPPNVKDWPLLEEAVDVKIADQEEFVGWWNENVRPRGNQPDEPKGADRGLLDKLSAEAATGIKHQQVSRGRKHLADKPKYRERLLLAAYRMVSMIYMVPYADSLGRNTIFPSPQETHFARAPCA